MANPWFRLYSEFAHDPKVQMMSEAMQRRYIMLMCIRCNGHVTLHDDEVAFHLRITAEDWAQTKELFIKKGFIDSELNLLNWEKRQFKNDSTTSSAERVRRHREKKKQAGNGDVTSDETLHVTLDNAADTDTDTDKEREEGKKQPRAGALSRPDDVAEQTWADWSQLRKTKKAPVTQTVLNGARREAAKAGIPLETFLQIWCVRGSQGMQAEWITANDLKQAGAQSQQSSVGRFV